MTVKFLWWSLAYLACVVGFGWLALAMQAHWQQVRGLQRPTSGTASALRALGIAALFGSLLLCLRADHASMAVLVWVMNLAAASLTVTFMLTWQPKLLSPLLMWVRRDAPSTGDS